MFNRRNQHIPVLDVVSEDRLLDNDFPFYSQEEGSLLCSSSSLSSDSLCSSESLADMEAESSFSRGPLESMSSLEDSLPIKKGLSRFFNGKSRSFSSLAEVKSIKDIPKPENPYAKKRHSRCATSSLGGIPDRSRVYPPKSSAGISKKPVHSSNNTKATLALALAMGETGDLENGGEASPSLATLSSSNKWLSCSAPSRSFSLSDLQRVGSHFSSPGKA